jgi:hypothetical protein
VLACAEPFEDDTLVWSLVLELPLPVWLLPVLGVVDELPVLLEVEVSCAGSVAARAANPKPAVAATAAIASPAVSAATRRLPCSRDVIAPPLVGFIDHGCRL